MASDKNRYSLLIEKIFAARHVRNAKEVTFERDDITRTASALGIPLPKNVGDVIYSFRYRASLPESIRKRAPKGMEWVIRPVGHARYKFALTSMAYVAPNDLLSKTKIPDATPGIIAKYALNDEQALLARVRYNRLVDIFSGVACYSLQNHLRTTVKGMGQVETDEVYVGVDRRGMQYVFPVQAKVKSDRLGIVQIEQDFAMCAAKLPALICRPIAAQLVTNDLIALFAFEEGENGVTVADEKHYLVSVRK